MVLKHSLIMVLQKMKQLFVIVYFSGGRGCTLHWIWNKAVVKITNRTIGSAFSTASVGFLWLPGGSILFDPLWVFCIFSF